VLPLWSRSIKICFALSAPVIDGAGRAGEKI
jgi:hypothetical protein